MTTSRFSSILSFLALALLFLNCSQKENTLEVLTVEKLSNRLAGSAAYNLVEEGSSWQTVSTTYGEKSVNSRTNVEKVCSYNVQTTNTITSINTKAGQKLNQKQFGTAALLVKKEIDVLGNLDPACFEALARRVTPSRYLVESDLAEQEIEFFSQLTLRGVKAYQKDDIYMLNVYSSKNKENVDRLMIVDPRYSKLANPAKETVFKDGKLFSSSYSFPLASVDVKTLNLQNVRQVRDLGKKVNVVPTKKADMEAELKKSDIFMNYTAGIRWERKDRFFSQEVKSKQFGDQKCDFVVNSVNVLLALEGPTASLAKVLVEEQITPMSAKTHRACFDFAKEETAKRFIETVDIDVYWAKLTELGNNGMMKFDKSEITESERVFRASLGGKLNNGLELSVAFAIEADEPGLMAPAVYMFALNNKVLQYTTQRSLDSVDVKTLDVSNVKEASRTFDTY